MRNVSPAVSFQHHDRTLIDRLKVRFLDVCSGPSFSVSIAPSARAARSKTVAIKGSRHV